MLWNVLPKVVVYRLMFLEKLLDLLGDKYSNLDTTSYVEKDFSHLLTVVKEFQVDLWEGRKLKLYCKDASPVPQSNS